MWRWHGWPKEHSLRTTLWDLQWSLLCKAHVFLWLWGVRQSSERKCGTLYLHLGLRPAWKLIILGGKEKCRQCSRWGPGVSAMSLIGTPFSLNTCLNRWYDVTGWGHNFPSDHSPSPPPPLSLAETPVSHPMVGGGGGWKCWLRCVPNKPTCPWAAGASELAC